MKTKFILLLMMFFTALLTFSQNGILVKGIVVEKESREALPFANVKVNRVESDDIWQQVADDKGAFYITLPNNGEYTISISYLGKEPYSRIFRIDNGGADLGVIALNEDSHSLKDVVVKGVRQLVKFEIDKLTYDVTEDPISKSSSLLDVLPRIPMLTIMNVNGESQIQVKGKSNFKVYLNGKPSNMFASNPVDVFRIIPAKSVEKIEVITDPGVKYDAEGVDGIINIITVSEKLEGYRGSINLGISTQNNYTEGLFFSAKKGSLGVTARVNRMDKNRLGGITESSRLAEYGGMKNLVKQEGTAKANKFGMTMGSAEITYEIDSLNLVSLSGNYRGMNLRTEGEALESVLINDNLVKRGESFAEMRNKRGSWDLGADYQRSTMTQGEMFTLSYRLVAAPNETENIYRYEPEVGNDILSGRKGYNRAQFIEHTGQVDYVKPLTTSHQISMGLKAISRVNSSVPKYYFLDSGVWIENPDSKELKAEKFSHRYNIFAGYGEYKYHKSNWQIKGGFRVEGGRLNVLYEKSKDANFSHPFTTFVPQTTIAYLISPTQTIKANYNMQVLRASIGQLNPYEIQINDYNVSFGNPDLKTTKSHTLSLDYSFYSRKVTIMPSISYSMGDNGIGQYSYVKDDNSGILVSTYGNILNERVWRGNLYMMWNALSWLKITVSGNVSVNNVESEKLNLKKQYITGSVFNNASVSLPKKWYLTATYGLMSRGGLQMVMKPFDFHQITLSKSLLKDKLSLSISADGFLRKYNSFEGTTKGDSFQMDFRNMFLSREFSFKLSYSFGEMKSQVKKVKRTIVNDDILKSDDDDQGV